MPSHIKTLIFISLVLILAGCGKKEVIIPGFPGGLSESQTVNWMNDLCQKYGGMTQTVGVEKYKTNIQVRNIEYKTMTLDMFVENAEEGRRTIDKVTITIPLQTLINSKSNVYRPDRTDIYMFKFRSVYPDGITHSINEKSGKLAEFQIPFYEEGAASAFQDAVFHVANMQLEPIE